MLMLIIGIHPELGHRTIPGQVLTGNLLGTFCLYLWNLQYRSIPSHCSPGGTEHRWSRLFQLVPSPTTTEKAASLPVPHSFQCLSRKHASSLGVHLTARMERTTPFEMW